MLSCSTRFQMEAQLQVWLGQHWLSLMRPAAHSRSPGLTGSSSSPCHGGALGEHLESSGCTPGQDLANWYILVRTGTYQYMTVHDSTRIPHLYETVCTSTYLYILQKRNVADPSWSCQWSTHDGLSSYILVCTWIMLIHTCQGYYRVHFS